MFFYETKPKQFIIYLVLINLLFVNIFFAIYIYYNYDVNSIYKKTTLYFFVPLWGFLYMILYTSARQYLAGWNVRINFMTNFIT